MVANGYDLVGAGVGSILNFVANERNNSLQRQLQEDAQNWNAQQAVRANQWSIQQWNRENAYNDPQAQMKRLREAGINPALAYASGVFNQAATSPSVSMSDSARPARTNAWREDPLLLSSLEIAASQRELLKSEAVKNYAEADESVARTPTYAQSIAESKARVADYDSQIEKRLHEIALLDADEKLRIAQESHIHFNEWLEQNRFMLDQSEIFARIDLYEKQGLAYEAAAARDFADAALSRRELYELVCTYGVRFGKMQAEMWGERYYNAEIFAKLEKLGIKVDENGRISVEPGGYTEAVSSDVYQYAEAICELIGTIFGSTFAVVGGRRSPRPTRVSGFGRRN